MKAFPPNMTLTYLSLIPLALVALCISASKLSAQQRDVWVIGSTHSYSEGGDSGMVHEKSSNLTTIVTRLHGILSTDPVIRQTVTKKP
jgi:hypothetical protein